jgi:hypothetical protein
MTKLSDELIQLQHNNYLIPEDIIKRVELLESFYDLAIKERDYERYKYDALKAELEPTKNKLLQWESACLANREDFKGVLADKDAEIKELKSCFVNKNAQLQDALRLLWYTRMPTGVKLEEVINDLGYHALWGMVNELLNPLTKE